ALRPILRSRHVGEIAAPPVYLRQEAMAEFGSAAEASNLHAGGQEGAGDLSADEAIGPNHQYANPSSPRHLVENLMPARPCSNRWDNRLTYSAPSCPSTLLNFPADFLRLSPWRNRPPSRSASTPLRTPASSM